MRWMNPEPIVQSEVSQKEEDRHCMFVRVCGEAALMDPSAGQLWTRRPREQACGHSAGGQGGADRERSTEAYT